MKIINFREDYNNKSKLNIFPTIRDEAKGYEGTIVICKFPDKEFEANILSVSIFNPIIMDYHMLNLARIDTGLRNYEDIYQLLKSFYPNKMNLFMHILEKVIKT